MAQTDLGAMLWLSEGPAAGLAAKRLGATFARGPRARPMHERSTRAESLWLEFDGGQWDDLSTARTSSSSGSAIAARDGSR